MPLVRELLSPTSFAPLSPATQLTDRGFRARISSFPSGFTQVPGTGSSLPGVGTSGFTVGGGNEPPAGPSIPGIPTSLSGLFDLAGQGVDLLERLGVLGGDDSVPGVPFSGPATPGPCPGLLSVRLPDGSCLNLEDVAPGGDPAVTGQVNGRAPTAGFGPPVNGRFGVGVIPRVEAQTVRRCPRGMALGKDGVCYDGLTRNSPKREWPMGMKPLLTPGERNAIRIASRAAGKLSRSQKSIRKTARALAKVC